MPDYFLKKKSLLDRFKDNHGRTGYIQSARAEHTWSNPIKRNRRTKELNGWIKSFAGKKHIRKLARFNTLNNGKNENLEEAMNWINVTDNTKEILKNGSEKSSLNTIEDVVADLAYAQAASDTAFGKPTTAKSILWKAAENFKASELNFDDNGSFIEDFIVNYEDQFREIYPYAVQDCDWLKLDPDFDKTYNSDDKFPFVEWVISQVAKELFKYAPADAKESKEESKTYVLSCKCGPEDTTYCKNKYGAWTDHIKDAWEGSSPDSFTDEMKQNFADSIGAEIADLEIISFEKFESKKNEVLVLPNPTIIYKGPIEDAKKAFHYVSKILADKGLGWGRVSWRGPKNGEFHYGHPEKDVYTVTLRGSNDLIKDSFAVYKDAFGNDFWNNCDADPQGWVNPQTIDRYDVATPRQESKGVDKKHEGFVGEWQSKIMQGLEAIKGNYGFDIESDEITDPRHGVTTVYDIIARNNGLTQSLAQVGPEYFHTYTDADFVYSKPFARKDYTDTEAISKLTKVIKDFYSQNPTMARSESKKPADEKLGYEKGHKNSNGEDAPWVIRSHEDNRVLASFAKKKDAEEHLKRMKQYSKNESKQNEGLSNEKVKDAVKFAATEAGLENYLDVDSDGAMSVTVSLPINSDDLKMVRWVIDSNDGTITEYLDTEKNLVRDFTDDESLVSMLTLLFQTSRMELRDWLPKKSEALDLETYACYIEFASESDAKGGMELVTGWTPTRIKNLVVVEGLSKSAAEYLWKDWLNKCTDAGLDIKDKGEVYKDSIDATDKTKSEAHDLDTYKSDVLSDLVVNLFHGEDWAKRLVDEYADAIEDAFARGDTSMEIATEIDTMAGKHESKNVSLKEIARTLDTAINKDGNYSVKDNTSGVTATDKDRTQTIRVSKDLKVELEDKDGKHSYEAQSLRDLSKYIRRAVKGEYVNEDFHRTQVKDAVYDVINRHNLNNAVKVSYLGNSVVCKYADRTLRIQPDLLTTMSTKDGDNIDTYPTNLKELDGYLDRVFGHYADELSESKQSEGIKLKLLDTITVPQWLWDAYTYSQEYSLDEYGVDLNDDEMAIFYDFKEKYKDCHLDDRGEEPDFHSRNDFDCYGGNCYVVDVYTKTDVKEKKSEKLFNKQELEALARGADILDQLQYRFSFSFYSPKTYTDAVDTALAMNAGGDKRIAYETIGDSEFRLYTDDPYNAIRFRDRLSNRAGISAEDLASTFRSAVGIRKNGGFATEDEQDTIGRYAAENYVSFSVSEDNSTMYVEGELPNVVEFFEAISSAEPA